MLKCTLQQEMQLSSTGGTIKILIIMWSMKYQTTQIFDGLQINFRGFVKKPLKIITCTVNVVIFDGIKFRPIATSSKNVNFQPH